MIIWLNGAFGAGKTQTAYELKRRLPGSMVYDPEVAGAFLQKVIPKEAATGDFQDYPMWREVTYSTLAYLNKSYKGIILVPMTITEPLYFWETIGRLRKEGIDLHHLTLRVSRETLAKRLRSRGEGGDSWSVAQMDRCLEALEAELFAEHLDTDELTVSETAESIAARLQLRLRKDDRSRFGKFLTRWFVQLRN